MEAHNICLINDSFPPEIDGVANAVTNYARILNGFSNVSVLTPFHPEADDGAFDFPVLRYPSIELTGSLGYRAGVPLSAALMQQVENAEFDLIHCHCPITSAILARMIRDRIDKPVVLTYHTKFDIDIANCIHGKLVQQEAVRLLAENISACDEVWTVSRGAGENLRKIGYTGSYTVMPNGVDLPKGRLTDEQVYFATKDYALPENVPVFLFVGRMMWYKGIRIILDALAELHTKKQPFRMVFVGGGGDLDEIKTYTQALGLSGEVIFVPPEYDRERIRAWYCRADLFLFPSTFDTNGLVVREAAACALASVLVAGSCAAEDTEDGKSAFLIEQNAGSMAALLLRLCKKPEAIRQVGENAQTMLYLSWEDAVKNAYERYGLVMENYAAGVYPSHTRLSDGLFHATAQAMDDISWVRSQIKTLLELDTARRLGRQERFTERYSRLREELREGLERFL